MENILKQNVQAILGKSKSTASMSVTEMEIHKQKKMLAITTRKSHTKTYQFTADKRQIQNNFSTLPFGY